MTSPTDYGAYNRFAGERLREARRKLGYSRRRLARLAGLNRKAVRDMERNRIRPSRAAYERLANALGLTIDAATRTLLVTGPPDHRGTEES